MRPKLIKISLITFILLELVVPNGFLIQAGTVIYVPDDYSTIQAAVDAASPGDTIIVRDGTYTENINVNKDHLTIKSENGAEQTIVQAADSDDHVFEVTADYVDIKGFTIKGAIGQSIAGIRLHSANHCSILRNTVSNNDELGISLYYSSNNMISENNVLDNGEGIFLQDSSHNNVITGNRILDNTFRGIYLHSSLNNTINNNMSLNNKSGVELYHSLNNVISYNILKNKQGLVLVDSRNNTNFLNNFINTVYNVVSIDSANNWNSPEPITYTYNGKTYINYLGNYWGNYSGGDADGDGIGDTFYNIDGEKDSYPLMQPFENYLGKPFSSIEGEGHSSTAESFNQDAIALLIQDYNPWSGKNTHDALNELNIPHDVINSSHLATQDLSKYQFILYVSAQDNNYYLNLKNNLPKISNFVSSGGLLIAHSCDGGWDGSGDWRGFSILPGGVTHLMHWDSWQYLSQSIRIVEPGHGVVKSDEFTLTDDYLDDWGWSTHGIFTNFLNNTNIKNPRIIMQSNEGDGGDGPTYIEYDFGAGKVLATMQTVEWGYFNGSQGWVGNRPELLRNEIRFAKKWEKAPKEFWVEIKEDGECIYQDESLVTKLKCLPQGWILKVPNPEKKYKSWNDVPTTTQIIDATDGVSGWTNKEWLNYEAEKQKEWEDKTERLNPSKNPNEGGTVPVILEAVNHYYNNVQGIPPNFESFDTAFQSGELEYGKTNDSVKWMQKILKVEIGHPFYPLETPATGYFGDTTKNSLKEFQMRNDLDNKDGVVGEATKNKLNKLLNLYRITESAFRSSNDVDPYREDNDNFLSLFKLAGFPIELILGITAQESGGIQFNNEKVARTPWGRGIMQIDKPDASVGQGSRIKWYKDGKINYCRGDEQACRHYYTNTPQGVWVNIKDGLRVLQDKYALVNKANLTDVTNTNCKDIKEITKEELIWLSTVYRYNQGSPYCAQRVTEIWNCYQKNKNWDKCKKEIKNYIETKWCLIKDEEKVKGYCQGEFEDCLGKLVAGDPFYLKNIGKKLYEGVEIFFGEGYQDKIKDYCKKECGENEVCKNKCENKLLLTEEEIKNLAKKLICANNNRVILELGSPVEIRVCDSEGKITGLLNGELKEELLNSMYDEENKFLTIFFPSEFYRYEIKGIEEGEYSLGNVSITNGALIDFGALNIPISTGAIHQYNIDWDKLLRGEAGVTLQIDVNGDGIFEKTVIADNDLTYDEFILQTETVIDFDPDTLNLKSKGKVVTSYIELPESFDISQINIANVLLNDSVPALTKPTEIGDYDKDGIPDLMVKFERNEVQAILSSEEKVPIAITGKVFHNDIYLDFKGEDVIKVIK